jgi:hypothetical protein
MTDVMGSYPLTDSEKLAALEFALEHRGVYHDRKWPRLGPALQTAGLVRRINLVWPDPAYLITDAGIAYVAANVPPAEW